MAQVLIATYGIRRMTYGAIGGGFRISCFGFRIVDLRNPAWF